jgi:hypothetical protein
VSLQPRTLRIAGGVGALLVCGGAGTAVAADQRPAGAPLNPPVSHAATAAAATATPGTALVIPPSSTCPAGRRLNATASAQRRRRAACGQAAATPDGGTQPLTPSVGEAGGDQQPLTFSYVS